MKIVCWNIKEFSKNKITNSQHWPVIQQVITSADLAIVLEGPFAQSSIDSLAAEFRTKISEQQLRLQILKTESLTRGESESVIVFSDPNTVQTSDVLALDAGCAGIRTPVVFQVRGHGYATGGAVTFKTVAWHAPPEAKRPSDYFPRVLAAARGDEAIKLILGDFNFPISGNTSPFVIAGRDVPTMLDMDVNTEPTTFDDAWGGARNDFILVREGFRWSAAHHAGRLNTIKFVKSWAEELAREEDRLDTQIEETSDEGRRRQLQEEKDGIALLMRKIARAPARLSVVTPPLERQQSMETGRGAKRGRDRNDQGGPPQQFTALEQPLGRPQEVGIGASRTRRSTSQGASPKTLSAAYKIAKAVSDHVPMMIVI
jgi:hypothetical protein